MKNINRFDVLERIKRHFRVHSVCALLGPRQCGKTTLSKVYAEWDSQSSVYRFDLEDPTHLAQLENPKLALEHLNGLIIIDEIQLRPNLFPYLRVLVDQKPECRYLILGSASRDLIQQSSETLAGRIGYLHITPLNLSECGSENWRKLWCRGGFPRSYLAEIEDDSTLWRQSYIQTFLERDLNLFGVKTSPQDMRRLWTILAHYHGNIINYSDMARSLMSSDMTVRRHLDILQGAFMVRVLKPWFENISKRQVKTPKVYIRDSGLLHALLNIDPLHLTLHPKTAASWEGFALESVIQHYQPDDENCYFWSTTGEAELDLLLCQKNKKYGFEFKYTDTPRLTSSMKKAYDDLKLDELTLVTPGKHSFSLAENIKAVGLETLIS